MVTFQLTHLLRGATKQHFLRHAASQFQLTHLLRGATNSGPGGRPDPGFQLTHLLRGATTDNVGLADAVTDFNSRTSCEVRHPRRYVCSGHKIHFNSRTSCEVRHDPRVQNAIPLTDFNSRTSCEVRHKSAAHKRRARKFQLTHLLRGATSSFRYSLCSYFISTHAPLARCDLMPFLRARARIDFNSRTSCEVRRTAYSSFPHYIDFNSRTSCEVRQRFNFVHRGELYFNSRTSCEVRLAQCVDHIDPPDFNSRTSCEVRLWRPAVPGRSGLFQLTHLLRGATIRRIAKIKNADFNSRTSCEVRHSPAW